MGSYVHTLEELQQAESAPCPIAFWSRVRPRRAAIRTASEAWTYSDLGRAVARASTLLSEITPGTAPRIAIYRAGVPDTVVWMFAALRLGGNAFFPGDRRPSGRLRSFRDEAGFDVLVTGDETADAGSETFQVAPPEAPATLRMGEDSVDEPTGSPMAGGNMPLPEPAGLDLDALATRLFTSGTASLPRIAAHSVRSHLSSALAANRRTPLDADDSWLASLPLYHVGGLGIVFRTLVGGASVAVAKPGQPLGEAVLETEATHVSVVATQLRRLLDELDEPPEGLKTVLVGGGPVDAAILIQAVEAGFPIRTTYGMTEFASQIATSEIWARKGATLNCGRPLDGFEIRISPEGELLAKGPALFSGYWVDGILKSPELIDGWLATGDLGSISDGALTVRGRKDEVFISGGENVQPSEIESALLALDEIVEAVVVPIPDAEFDWRPAAVIKWRTDRPDEDWIRSRLAERLPGYMIPVVLLDWPSAAEGAGIKPDRPALKAAVPTYWREWGRFLQESGDISAVD